MARLPSTFPASELAPKIVFVDQTDEVTRIVQRGTEHNALRKMSLSFLVEKNQTVHENR